MSDNLAFKLHTAVIESRTIEDHDNIYIVEDGIIGKRCRNGDRAQSEYNIAKFLFGNGVQVPKMYKIITPDSLHQFDNNSPREWYILMQRIKGETIDDLSGIDKKEAIHQRKLELEKVSALNVHHPDSAHDTNSIFDIRRRKLYLIDFEHWRKL
jgi:hypothetical protein